jgi:hypothetical protein
MSILEYILYTTSVAVEKDEISKADLIRVLHKLVSVADFYAEGRDEGSNKQLLEFHHNFGQRFGHVMHSESPKL